jgi:predicted DCC family thiol-disulfide oxidoreductase YuxK
MAVKADFMFTLPSVIVHRLAGLSGAMRNLGWMVAYVRAAAIIPERLCARTYALIARNRYRWLGQTGYCARLTEEQRGRLV